MIQQKASIDVKEIEISGAIVAIHSVLIRHLTRAMRIDRRISTAWRFIHRELC